MSLRRMARNIRRGGNYGIGLPPKDEEGRTVILGAGPEVPTSERVEKWARKHFQLDQDDASRPVLAGEE